MADNLAYDQEYGIELTASQTAGGGFGFGRISSQPEVDSKAGYVICVSYHTRNMFVVNVKLYPF